ncbi:MAG: NADPH-dependent FMN reductase [Saprospiraceae bacterium]
MKIITVSATNHPKAGNVRLLQAIALLATQHVFTHFSNLGELPLFTLAQAENQLVKDWKTAVRDSDAVIFSTPEYLHNLPAALKSALEWLTTGGELAGKKVIAMTCTPHAPRGEQAMQSLLWSLNALDANVVVNFPVYGITNKLTEDNQIIDEELGEMLELALEQL